MLQDFFETLVFMEKKTVSDGMGGLEVAWIEGAEFQGSVTTDNSIEMRIAEQQGIKSLYTITTNKNVILNYNDVVKRKSDGKIYRVTSNGNDVMSPKMANINISQVKAEIFETVK